MVKQKFYEYVDKYLMAMGFDLSKYEDLHERTIRELALELARTGARCLDAAWDVDEMNADLGEEYMYAPDPYDPMIGEGLKEACRKMKSGNSGIMRNGLCAAAFWRKFCCRATRAY